MLIDKGCFDRGCACYDDRIDKDAVEVVRKEWVGLTVEEARKFYEKYTDREELIYAIDKFLEEKNT